MEDMGDVYEQFSGQATVLEDLESIRRGTGTWAANLPTRFTYFLHGVTSNIESRFSKLTPRLSGRSAKDTRTVRSVHEPNRK